MNATQQERRIQALYDDANVSRRYLCERVVHLEADMGDTSAENAKLRELATYALRHIVEVWCEGEGRDLYRGKPCEDCVDYGSSDCPKCMPRVFDVSGIEVD